jgi:hypothetical protein
MNVCPPATGCCAVGCLVTLALGNACAPAFLMPYLCLSALLFLVMPQCEQLRPAPLQATCAGAPLRLASKRVSAAAAAAAAVTVVLARCWQQQSTASPCGAKYKVYFVKCVWADDQACTLFPDSSAVVSSDSKWRIEWLSLGACSTAAFGLCH